MLPAKAYVYALVDPRDGRVRYVGQSIRPRERLINHLCEARRGRDFHSYRWMRQLLGSGLRPELIILQETSTDLIDAAEQRWIADYRSQGASLTNSTDGGGGMRGHRQSVEHTEKIRAANRGKKRSQEVRDRFRLVQNDPIIKATLIAKRKGNKSRTGQVQSQEEKDKRAAANRGKVRLPEFCEAMRQKALGVRHSEEAKQKMSKSKLAMISPERRSEIAKIANLAMQEKRKCRSRAE